MPWVMSLRLHKEKLCLVILLALLHLHLSYLHENSKRIESNFVDIIVDRYL